MPTGTTVLLRTCSPTTRCPNYASAAPRRQGTTLTPAPDATPPGPVTTVIGDRRDLDVLTIVVVDQPRGRRPDQGVMIRRAVGSTPPVLARRPATLVVNKAAPATSHVDTGLNPGHAVLLRACSPTTRCPTTQREPPGNGTTSDAGRTRRRRARSPTVTVTGATASSSDHRLDQPRGQPTTQGVDDPAYGRQHRRPPTTTSGDTGGQQGRGPATSAHRHRARPRTRSTPTHCSPTTRCPTTLREPPVTGHDRQPRPPQDWTQSAPRRRATRGWSPDRDDDHARATRANVDEECSVPQGGGIAGRSPAVVALRRSAPAP